MYRYYYTNQLWIRYSVRTHYSFGTITNYEPRLLVTRGTTAKWILNMNTICVDIDGYYRYKCIKAVQDMGTGYLLYVIDIMIS